MSTSPKPLRIRHQYFHLNLLSGICFLLGGIVGYVDSDISLIFQIVLFSAAVLFLVLIRRIKREAPDEMAEENITKAGAISANFMHYFFCIAMPIVPLIAKSTEKLDINWVLIMTWSFYVYIGTMRIVQAIVFKFLEDN